MHSKISFKEFIDKLSLKSDIPREELESMVFDIFVNIRVNTECGSWIDIDDFGSFHPLWYNVKKQKENTKVIKKTEVKKEKKEKNSMLKYMLFIATFLIVMFFLFFILKDDVTQVPVEKQEYKCFTNVELNQTKTTQKFYDYNVTAGDNLYTISKLLYGDSKYWPLIYVENKLNVKDMDSIYPSDILTIPRIPQGSTAQNELAIVYIQAYKDYKILGKDNEAHWLLYWGNKNIDSDLLIRFSKEIDLDDRKQVDEYLKRFSD